jgi:hypothetical protein
MRSAAATVAILSMLLGLAAGGCGAGQGSPQGGGGTVSTSPHRTREENGEESVEKFGREAVGAERTSLLRSFETYLGAIATGDATEACDHLSAAVRRSLAKLAGIATSRGSVCARVLPALLSPRAPRIARAQGNGKVAEVRVGGGRAFVVFHAPGPRLYMLVMVREHGAWKATTIAATILAPSAETLGGG